MRPTRSKPAAVVSNRLPPPLLEPLVVRVRVAAHLLAMSERKVWNLVGSGQLTVSRIGGVTLVTMASIRALIATSGASIRGVPRRPAATLGSADDDR